MAPKLDAGPILAERATEIGECETAGELADRLAEMGAELVTEVVNRLASGDELAGRQQPGRAGFYARKLTKADGRIDWSRSAQEIRDRVRGLTPWPGAYCELRTADGSQRVTLLSVSTGGAVPEEAGREPGAVLQAGADGVVVQSGDGAITITELKPSGRRAMAVADFLRGHRVEASDRFE
jgi:methionyl-tRNA formyltransferase